MGGEVTSRRPSGHPTDEVANRGVKDQGGTKNTKKIATAKSVSSSLGLGTMACTAPLVVPPALGRGRTGALFFSQGFFRAMGIDVVARYVRESGRSRRRAKPWFRQDRPQEIPRSLGGGPRRPAPGRYRNGDCGTRGNQPRSRVDTGTGTSCPSSSCENVAGDIRGRAGCAAAAEACTSA